MTQSLSKLLALLLLVAVLLVAWIDVFVPLQDWRSETIAQLETSKQEIMRLKDAQSRLQSEEISIGTAQSENFFWKANQTGEAYALVQGALSRAATQNGISFRAMTPLPAGQRDGLNSALVRIEFEADLAQLTGFLREIEYATPALPVDRAAIRRLVRPNDTSRLPRLFTQIDIAAPLLIEEGS